VQRGDEVEPAVDAVLTASQAFVGLAARTIPGTVDVTLPQWRALVLIDRCGEMKVGATAEELGVSASTGTRLCDRLVRKASSPGNCRPRAAGRSWSA
jgi:hypothetical protein